MSASDPTAIVPLRGKSPKSLAGAVATSCTKRFGENRRAVHAAGVDQAQPVLDARAAVGNFGEVVPAQLLLFLETERAMVGGNHLQRVLRQPLPQFFLMPFFAQRRREHIFGAFESRRLHLIER